MCSISRDEDRESFHDRTCRHQTAILQLSQSLLGLSEIELNIPFQGRSYRQQYVTFNYCKITAPLGPASLFLISPLRLINDLRFCSISRMPILTASVVCRCATRLKMLMLMLKMKGSCNNESRQARHSLIALGEEVSNVLKPEEV